MDLAVSLLVLRCKDVEATRRFYERLGLIFTKEKHSAGPEHYVWESAGFVLELYPSSENQPADCVRLGFSTSLLTDLAGHLRPFSCGTVPKPTYATADPLRPLLHYPHCPPV